MASSYTPILRLTLPATGELQGTWGDTVNNGITSLTEAAIAGTAAVVMSDANHTLTVANGATDEARRMFVTLTGALTATRNVICPAVSKMYVVRNNTTGGQSIVFKTSAGTGVTVANGQSMLLYCDGTNVVEAFSAFAGNASTATTLQTSRTLWGQSFNGSANVTGNLTSVGNITGTSAVTLTATSGTLALAATGANIITASTNGSERLRIDSAGNVGIGTSLPVARFDVQAPANGVIANFMENTSGATRRIRFSNNGTTNTIESTTGVGATNLAFAVDGTERMRIDSSGNLGLGVTPSAWALSGNSALQVRNAGFAGWADNAYVTANAFLNASGNFNYIATNFATQYRQAGGQHQWYTAPSGTAGNAISFTQAMTLGASGNLLVGTSDSASTTGVGMKLRASATGPTMAIVGSDTTSSTAAFTAYSTGAGAYRFQVGYNGTIFATNTSISAISDASLKENVRDLETGLQHVMELRPRRFDWKNGDGRGVAGFVAQEVARVLPDLVQDYQYSEGVTKKTLKMGDILPTVVKAVQDLKAIVDAQAERIAALEKQ